MVKCFSTFLKNFSYIQPTFFFHVREDFYAVRDNIPTFFLFFFFCNILISFTCFFTAFLCFFWLYLAYRSLDIFIYKKYTNIKIEQFYNSQD